MKARGTVRRRHARSVSASELAQMGVCERLVVFEQRYGKRFTLEQKGAMRRGQRVHEWFCRDGQIDAAREGRCSVAAIVFGEVPETMVLRNFRDRVMRRWPGGRWLTAILERLALLISHISDRSSLGRSIVRAILRPVVWCADRWLKSIGTVDVD